MRGLIQLTTLNHKFPAQSVEHRTPFYGIPTGSGGQDLGIRLQSKHSFGLVVNQLVNMKKAMLEAV